MAARLPAPEGDPPEGFSLLMFAYQFAAGLQSDEAEQFDYSGLVTISEPTGLRLEFLNLTTSAAYDQLQCYARLRRGTTAPIPRPGRRPIHG